MLVEQVVYFCLQRHAVPQRPSPGCCDDREPTEGDRNRIEIRVIRDVRASARRMGIQSQLMMAQHILERSVGVPTGAPKQQGARIAINRLLMCDAKTGAPRVRRIPPIGLDAANAGFADIAVDAVGIVCCVCEDNQVINSIVERADGHFLMFIDAST